MDTGRFYDELATYYDLIFEDWDASMSRQGAVLAALIETELPDTRPPAAALRVLDAACGIGTQALPVAARGFRVTARDISEGAVARLRREAEARRLTIDVVVAFDNSIPHILSDADIEVAFRQFRKVLRPGGLCLCSVRDYDTVQRGVPLTLSYGERRRAGEVFRLRQEWTWDGTTHYQVAFIVDKDGPQGPTTVLRTVTRYYAVSVGRLLALMIRAGFDCRRVDETIYQPILLGRSA